LRAVVPDDGPGLDAMEVFLLEVLRRLGPR
jgi:hypothetical protein